MKMVAMMMAVIDDHEGDDDNSDDIHRDIDIDGFWH